jgi:hypothetical protein
MEEESPKTPSKTQKSQGTLCTTTHTQNHVHAKQSYKLYTNKTNFSEKLKSKPHILYLIQKTTYKARQTTIR